MTPFEYATGLFSIVIGLGVARVLGGIGTFITTRDRSASDWIVASWCAVILVNLGGWWIAVWIILQGQAEIDFAILLAVILATSLLYLATYVLTLGAPIDGTRHARTYPVPRVQFYYCLGAHFAVVLAFQTAFDLINDPRNVVETAILAAVASAGAAAKSTRSRVLHLVIWTVLLFTLLADNTPRIALLD
jgi:hypothetical protein